MANRTNTHIQVVVPNRNTNNPTKRKPILSYTAHTRRPNYTHRRRYMDCGSAKNQTNNTTHTHTYTLTRQHKHCCAFLIYIFYSIHHHVPRTHRSSSRIHNTYTHTQNVLGATHAHFYTQTQNYSAQRSCDDFITVKTVSLTKIVSTSCFCWWRLVFAKLARK